MSLNLGMPLPPFLVMPTNLTCTNSISYCTPGIPSAHITELTLSRMLWLVADCPDLCISGSSSQVCPASAGAHQLSRWLSSTLVTPFILLSMFYPLPTLLGLSWYLWIIFEPAPSSTPGSCFLSGPLQLNRETSKRNTCNTSKKITPCCRSANLSLHGGGIISSNQLCCMPKDSSSATTKGSFPWNNGHVWGVTCAGSTTRPNTEVPWALGSKHVHGDNCLPAETLCGTGPRCFHRQTASSSHWNQTPNHLVYQSCKIKCQTFPVRWARIERTSLGGGKGGKYSERHPGLSAM